jgi:hypothetical protein
MIESSKIGHFKGGGNGLSRKKRPQNLNLEKSGLSDAWAQHDFLTLKKLLPKMQLSPYFSGSAGVNFSTIRQLAWSVP